MKRFKRLRVLLSVLLCFALLFGNLSVFAEEQGGVAIDSQDATVQNDVGIEGDPLLDVNEDPPIVVDVVNEAVIQDAVVPIAEGVLPVKEAVVPEIEGANARAVLQTNATVGSGGFISIQSDRLDDNGKVFLVNNSVPTGKSVSGVSYDQSTNTLTLNNASGLYQIFIQSLGDVTINLIGINTFDPMGNIRGDLTDSLTIKGDGSLGFNASGEGGTFYGILADKLIIASGTISSNSMNLEIHNNLTINGGTVNLLSSKIMMWDGSNLIINDGTVNISAYYDNCMEVSNFQLNGGTVKIDNSYSNGILAKNVTINGGSLDAQSYGYDTADNGKAISATESIVINGGIVKSMSGNSKQTVSGLIAPIITIIPYATIATDVYRSIYPMVDPRNSVNSYNGEAYVKTSANDVPIPATGDVIYRTHVENVGWQGWKSEGVMSGTSGKSLRLEGIEIKTNGLGDNVGVEYQTHVQDIGWQDWRVDGNMSGTFGRSLRLEGIRVQLTGLDADKYDIYYQVHAQNIGWMGWAKNGESAGTEALSYRLEGINIIVTPKGENTPVSEKDAFVSGNVSCTYQTHVQNVGWQSLVNEGEMSGTTGKAFRLEGIKATMDTGYYDLGIEYQTHVQNIGWQGWRADGDMSGTSNQALRLEGIQMRLTGVDADKCDIYYQVHAQNYGWLGWAKNGESAGTAGLSYRLEGIRVMVIPKGGVPPTATALPFYSK